MLVIQWGSVMSTTRGRWPVFTAATTILLFSLASGVGHARDTGGHRDKGQHKSWYKKDKGPGWSNKDKPPVRGKPDSPKTPVSVPEPGTLVLFIAGLAVVVAFSRKRPKV